MAINCYLRLDGIVGEAQSAQQKGQIELLSLSWGANNAQAATAGGAGAGKVKISDFVVTKYVDSASPSLFLHVCNGARIATGTLSLVRAQDNGKPYITVNLTQVFITAVEFANTSSNPIESVSLSFASIQFSYTPTNKDGTLGQTITSGWDLTLNKVAS